MESQHLTHGEKHFHGPVRSVADHGSLTPPCHYFVVVVVEPADSSDLDSSSSSGHLALVAPGQTSWHSVYSHDFPLGSYSIAALALGLRGQSFETSPDEKSCS